jgi:hypothetical protein
MDEQNALFKNCYGMLETLNQEKRIGLSKRELLDESINLYAKLVGQIHLSNMQNDKATSPFDLVDWTSVRNS